MDLLLCHCTYQKVLVHLQFIHPIWLDWRPSFAMQPCKVGALKYHIDLGVELLIHFSLTQYTQMRFLKSRTSNQYTHAPLILILFSFTNEIHAKLFCTTAVFHCFCQFVSFPKFHNGFFTACMTVNLHELCFFYHANKYY